MTYEWINDFRMTPKKLELDGVWLHYYVNGERQSFSVGEIDRMRMRYHPGRIKRNNYETELHLNNGVVLKIPSLRYVSFGNFQDQGEAYKTFLQALANKARELNPEFGITVWSNPVSYFLYLFMMIGMYAILIFVIFTLFAYIQWLVFVKIALIVFYTPMLVRYFKRNRPSTKKKFPIPEDLLP